MQKKISNLINGNRLWKRHNDLAIHGEMGNGGVNRQALSNEDINARKHIIDWLKKLNIEVYTDNVANIFFRLDGQNTNSPPVLIGSHIDSQPSGGKYDGVFGVLAGIEIIESLSENNIIPKNPIEVVAWMNEEGSRFSPGMMGSSVYTGARSVEDVKKIKDDNGINVDSEIKKMHLSFPNLKIKEFRREIKCFIEAHIEQGPILELNQKRIGIVTGIQGKRTFQIEVNGELNHVGTSPRKIRRDALVSSINIIQNLHKNMWDIEDVVRFTIGKLTVEPNAPSVVPSKVVFSIDLRHPDEKILTNLGDKISQICIENSEPCSVSVNQLVHDQPLEFPDEIISKIEKSSQNLDLPCMRLPSGAGHDARYLHYFCPTGMIFIPCKNGISHSPSESVKKEDLVAGTQVLAETVWNYAN
tara:strand:- start:81 stop:1322 length:1242 start_codon:yes stop_codon:yes gene_type:complete